MKEERAKLGVIEIETAYLKEGPERPGRGSRD